MLLPQPSITRLQALSPTSFLLRWDMGDAAASGFRIYRDSQLVATLSGETREYRDQNLTPSTVHAYFVEAFRDAEATRSRPVSDITHLPNMTTRETRAAYEVVVAGATPGGIAAALTLARLGHKVALLSPSPWLGGMMTGGLTRTDFGSMKSSGGLFKEFVDRAYEYYIKAYGANSPQAKASRNGYYFEPRVAKWIFHQMLAEQPNVTVMLDHHTRDVEKQGNRVTAVYVLDRPRMIRKTLLAKVFIDATYEGDLAAQAGAAYRMGREDKAEFNEEHAGELFWEPLQRKVVFGSGRGDDKVQAYNYRLCMTNAPDKFHPFPAPSDYERSRYLTLIPDIESGRLKNMEQVLSILPLPNQKFDANNHPLGNPSSDLIGGSDGFPEADMWQREPIAEAHRQHILGLMYFLQHDPQVPAKFQQEARRWGLAYDEFVDNNRFPTQLYVREGRRIIGPYIFTENDARSASPELRPNFHFDSIGVADYPIDSHATSLEKDGLLEGFFYLPGAQTQPSQIPYRTMTPNNVEGVLVSGSVSCTHIGYGTLRMEPVFMALGTTAGTAAHLALSQGVAPSQVDTRQLQRQLLLQKQVICVFHDVPLEHPAWEALQYYGTKGFFPEFNARPDANITHTEAAQWLWQWVQQNKTDLQSVEFKEGSDSAAGPESAAMAFRSLQSLGILDEAAPAAANTVLTPADSEAWLTSAARVLGAQLPSASSTPTNSDAVVTRAAFCQRLYQTEYSIIEQIRVNRANSSSP